MMDDPLFGRMVTRRRRGFSTATCAAWLVLAAVGPAVRADTAEGLAETTNAPAPAVPRQLTLPQAFTITLAHNQGIRAAKLTAESDMVRIEAARGEFDPALFAELTGGHAREPIATQPIGRDRSGNAAFITGARQRLVTGTEWEIAASADHTNDRAGTRALDPQYSSGLALVVRQDLLKDAGIDINQTHILIARNHWRISAAELTDVLIRDLYAVERAYWALFFARADLAVRQQQLDRAKALVERAEARVAAGEAAPIEITRASANAAAQAVAIVNARNRSARITHTLLRAMGILRVDSVTDDFALADPPGAPSHQVTLAQAMTTARHARPDLMQAQLLIDNADLYRRFYANQRLPKVQLYGALRFAGLDDDFGRSAESVGAGTYDTWEAGVAVEWPLFNRKARANHRIARLEWERALALLQERIEDATTEVADALEDLRATRQRIAAAEGARVLAEDLLRAEEKSFALGRSGSIDVLDAQAAFAAAQRDLISAQTDYAIALANLRRAQGDFLTANGIAILDKPASAFSP